MIVGLIKPLWLKLDIGQITEYINNGATFWCIIRLNVCHRHLSYYQIWWKLDNNEVIPNYQSHQMSLLGHHLTEQRWLKPFNVKMSRCHFLTRRVKFHNTWTYKSDLLTPVISLTMLFNNLDESVYCTRYKWTRHT